MPQLIPSSALFRFRVPCYRYDGAVDKLKLGLLPAEYRIPCYQELDGFKPFADVRMAWTPDRLIWQLIVAGREADVRCYLDGPAESDGLHVWIDTRDMKHVQRGTRFCHRFAFLPAVAGRAARQPHAEQVWLERAGAHPAVIEDSDLEVVSRVTPTQYDLVASVRTAGLTGLDYTTGAKLGFFYLVQDHEKGKQFWSLSKDFGSIDEDPSLWGTVELVDTLP